MRDWDNKIVRILLITEDVVDNCLRNVLEGEMSH